MKQTLRGVGSISQAREGFNSQQAHSFLCFISKITPNLFCLFFSHIDTHTHTHAHTTIFIHGLYFFSHTKTFLTNRVIFEKLQIVYFYIHG